MMMMNDGSCVTVSVTLSSSPLYSKKEMMGKLAATSDAGERRGLVQLKRLFF